MDPRLNIITLGVKNLSKSRKFYEQGLGFPVAKASDEKIVFLKLNGICLALYPIDKLAEDITITPKSYPTNFHGFTLAHNTKSKDEVDQILDIVQKAGGKILKKAQDTFWGGYSGYFSDPDGYAWEVAYADFWKFDKNGNLILD